VGIPELADGLEEEQAASTRAAMAMLIPIIPKVLIRGTEIPSFVRGEQRHFNSGPLNTAP
jgi:hypothetical protein